MSKLPPEVSMSDAIFDEWRRLFIKGRNFGLNSAERHQIRDLSIQLANYLHMEPRYKPSQPRKKGKR